MKAVIVCLIWLVTSVAHARMFDTNFFRSLTNDGTGMATLSSPPPQHPRLPPIRTANAKVRIVKSTFEKTGTHYQTKLDEVCETTGPVDVYDLRSDPNAWITQPQKTLMCTSTVEGQSLNVVVVGSIILMKGEVFKTEPKFDIKLFSAYVYTDTINLGGQKNQFTTGQFASRDVNQKSGLISLNPNQMISCSYDTSGNTSCETDMPEVFYVVMEMVD